MDPFLLVKLLLLSCNLDEEGNQHFVTEKPEESQGVLVSEWCWLVWEGSAPRFLGSSGRRVQLCSGFKGLLKASPFSLAYSLSESCGPAFVCPGHASPFPATPDEAGPGLIASSRIVSKAPSWPLSSALLSLQPLSKHFLESLLQCHICF